MLLSLPNELLLEVVENFTDSTDVFYLLMTSKHLSNLLKPILVKASNDKVDSAAAAGLPLLHFAALRDDLTGAKLALRNAPNCLDNFVSDEGTALNVAVFEGFESMVEFLLTQGADPNAVDPNPQTSISPDTPLLTALSNVIEIQDTFVIETIPMVSEGIVRLLLQRGADPNTISHQGMNALLQAAHLGLPNIVSAILDTGKIDVNSRSTTGATALHISVARASGEGSLRVSELLLARGIDVNATDAVGRTAFSHARTEAVTTLLQSYGATGNNSWTTT